MGENPHYKDMLNLIRSADRKHDTYTVFRDFCEMAAISLANAVEFSQEREERYLRTAARHKDQIKLFPQILACLVDAMTLRVDDYLGRAFHDLNLQNKWAGQFFSPYPICRMMAKILVGDEVDKKIAARGFITANEPACGAGAMIIALCETMREAGYNYQQELHVTAQDFDPRAVHMTYIQLSLLHCPAVVIQGNTLAVESVEEWRTPAHVLGLWDVKLRQAAAEDAKNAPPPAPKPVRKGEQLTLF